MQFDSIRRRTTVKRLSIHINCESNSTESMSNCSCNHHLRVHNLQTYYFSFEANTWVSRRGNNMCDGL